MKLAYIIFLTIISILNQNTLAQGQSTPFESLQKLKNQTCYGAPLVPDLSNAAKCVGKVADKNSIAWSMPRKILFFAPNQAIVSAMGSWSKNQGQIWQLEMSQGQFLSAKLLFNFTDRTHGLRQGLEDWIYYADATKIYRFRLSDPTKTRNLVIKDLPDSYQDLESKINPSSHPLKEFIFLENMDLVVNVGAPSNDCSEEIKSFRACHQRDQQAELRKYKYYPITDSYAKSYQVIARGLRNSMGLLYNPELEVIYQAENAADHNGTPDEMNIVQTNLLAKDQDFGWPFCFGDKKIYPGYQNFKSFCNNTAVSPFMLFPAHAAPLDLIYYKGQMFPEYQDAIMTSWHGHRPSGSRIAIYKSDAQKAPLETYRIDSGGEPLLPMQLLPSNWAKASKTQPKGRPVGIDFNQDGAIYIIDDVNSTLYVVAKTAEKLTPTATGPSPEKALPKALNLESQMQFKSFGRINSKVFKKYDCQSCHSEIFTSNDLETYKNLLENRWLDPTISTLEGQLVWIKMTGHNGTRIMPPAPAENILSSSQLLNDFENWLMLKNK